MRPTADEVRLRELALSRLEMQRDFRLHLVIYVTVNALLILTWALTAAAFFWPLFPMLGWGLGVGVNGWIAYGRRPIAEAEIQREVESLAEGPT